MDHPGSSSRTPGGGTGRTGMPPALSMPPVRHNLPQIAAPTTSRLAVSKASLKEYPASIQPYANIVSMDELEKRKEPSTTPIKPSPSPSTVPTPVAEGTPTDTSPKAAAVSPGGPPTATGASPPTPIKLKIRRSIQQGHSQLTSSVTLGSEENAILNTSPTSSQSFTTHVSGVPPTSGKRRTKTKALLKGQSRKKMSSKLHKGCLPAESSPATSVSSLELTGEASPVVSPSESVQAPLLPKGGEPGSSPSESQLTKYLVGDLVWAKVSGHPWWPCMVSIDPFTGLFVRMAHRHRQQFHVQFFGEAAERGWITLTCLLDYEGPEALEEYCKKMLVTYPKNKEFAKKFSYKVSVYRQAAWDIAVAAIEEAFPLSRTQRKDEYTFEYKLPKKKLQEIAAARGIPSTPEGPPNGQVRQKRKYTKRKLKDIQTGETQSESDGPPKKRRRQSKGSVNLVNQSEAQFAVFCQKRRVSVQEEHPDFTEVQMQEFLASQWKELTEEDQQKFIPMGSDVTNLSEVMDTARLTARSGRVSKPTKKKLESEALRRLLELPCKGVLPIPSCGTMSPSLEISYEETISGVAAGGGQLWEPLGWQEPIPGPSKRQRRKKQVEDSGSDKDSVTKGDDKLGTVKRRRGSQVSCRSRDNDLEIFKLCNAGPAKKESICQICEQPGELITCEGFCLGSFHAKCLGLLATPVSPFKCEECASGVHTCFECKERSSDTKRCGKAHCGKFYHDACLAKLPNTRYENGHFYCPLHICATCAADNPKNPKAHKGRVYRCVRCPTAYHVGDYCLAAGSVNLAGFNTVCSRHFQPVKSQSHHSHINVSWCFICSSGGTLLCCERCPAAFHAECLKVEFPEGTWYCKDCSAGKRPLYGDIVWVKLGTYRWWPGEVCHPKNVPLNIQEKPHQVGEFPIRFFGSNDYFWTHQARVFLFQDGDKGSKDSTSAKGLAKIFQKAVQEAVSAFKVWLKAKEEKEQQEIVKNDKKPPPYKHVKTNVPVGNVVIQKANLAEIPRCECKPNSDAPCSSDTDCLNRMMMYECHPSVCQAGENCHNQRFQRRQYPEFNVTKTDHSGWGLQSVENLKKGQFVIEYTGELIDEDECHRRINQAHEDNVTNFYMLTLDGNRTIDAGPKGNLSRFMNHSCKPNCETQKWNVNGDVRVGLFASCDIPAGSELTFNYNLDCLGNEKTICRCSAPNCSGFLGVRPKAAAILNPEKKGKDMRRRKKKRGHKVNMRKEHEDDCYRCGEGGELVMCDKTKCPKAYHLQCLNLSKPPHGKWDCPWHHCDVCGKGATKLCTECPNSFCNLHIDDNIFDIGDGKLVCLDHDDLLAVLTTSRSDAKPKVDPNDEKSSSSGSDESDEFETSPSQSDSEMSLPGQLKETDPESALKRSGSVTNGSVKSTPCPSDTESDKPPTKKKRKSRVKLSPHHSDAESLSSVGQTSIPDDKVSVQSEKSSTSEVRSEKSAASSKSSTSRARSKQKKGSKPPAPSSIDSGPAVPAATGSKGETAKKIPTKTPQDKGTKKVTTKGGKKGNITKGKKKAVSEEEAAKNPTDSLDLPMFDDKDDDFPDLVIDIPAF